MEIERARDDVIVAATAAGTTIAIALLSGVSGTVEVATLPRVAPIAVYAVYRFSRKGGPYGSLDRPRNWALAALLTGVVVIVGSMIG